MAELQSHILNDVTLTTRVSDSDQIVQFVEASIRETSADVPDMSKLGLSYRSTDEEKKISLSYDGRELGSVDASDFVKDGMISDVSYDEATHVLSVLWNSDGGSKVTVANLSGLLDTYTAGEGLTCENGEFSLTAYIPAPVSVDSALSETSTNPVQNKAVTAALSAKCTTAEAVAEVTRTIPGGEWQWPETFEGYTYAPSKEWIDEHGDHGKAYYTIEYYDDLFPEEGGWAFGDWTWEDDGEGRYRWVAGAPEGVKDSDCTKTDTTLSLPLNFGTLTATRTSTRNAHGLARLVDLPTKTSDLTNDGSDGTHPFASVNALAELSSGLTGWVEGQNYLTEHQSLSGYYAKSETSSAAEISGALAGKQPSGDYATSAYVNEGHGYSFQDHFSVTDLAEGGKAVNLSGVALESDVYMRGVFDACLSAVRQYDSPEKVPLSAVVNAIWCLSKLQQWSAE